MGAWIEISLAAATSPAIFVAPSMGAWIEIVKACVRLSYLVCRSLYGSVD